MAITEDATVTSKGQVTIPKEIRDRLGIEAGTQVEFVLGEGGELEVRTKEPAIERLQSLRERLSEHDVDVDELRRESKRAWSGTRFGESRSERSDDEDLA